MSFNKENDPQLSESQSQTDATQSQTDASQSQVSVQATPVAGASAANAEGPKCTDPAHSAILRQLMSLYHETSLHDQIMEREEKAEDLPDKHDIYNVISTIREIHSMVTTICKMAKKANPELEMKEAPNPFDEGEGDW